MQRRRGARPWALWLSALGQGILGAARLGPLSGLCPGCAGVLQAAAVCTVLVSQTLVWDWSPTERDRLCTEKASTKNTELEMSALLSDRLLEMLQVYFNYISDF